MMHPSLLTVKEAALRIGTTPQYLHNLRHYNRGPMYQKVGRRVYYTPEDCDRWNCERLASRKAKAKAAREKKPRRKAA